MPPAHPFEGVPAASLRRTALASSAASLALGGALLAMGAPLVTPEAPHGLASFELAGGASEVSAVLAGWGEAGIRRAVAMTWLDFAFLAAYAASLASLSLIVRGARRFPGAARAGAWAASAAAACDLFENLLSLRLLAGSPGGAGAMAVLASVKFALAGGSLAWVAAGPFIPSPRD